MIIFGTRGLTFTLEPQEFHCPQCSTRRPGKLKHVRNFFTLYFIPVIPLNVAGRFVECDGCSGTFSEEILSYDPAQEEQDSQDKMLRVMVMAALADGRVDDAERQEIGRLYQEMTGFPVPPSKLEDEIRMAMTANADLDSYVASFAQELSGHGKALVVRFAFEVMSASGELQAGHQQQLQLLAQTLHIPQDQFVALIDQISQLED